MPTAMNDKQKMFQAMFEEGDKNSLEEYPENSSLEAIIRRIQGATLVRARYNRGYDIYNVEFFEETYALIKRERSTNVAAPSTVMLVLFNLFSSSSMSFNSSSVR